MCCNWIFLLKQQPTESGDESEMPQPQTVTFTPAPEMLLHFNMAAANKQETRTEEDHRSQVSY